MDHTANTRFSKPVIAFHWIGFLLIVGVYLFIELHEFFPRGSDMRLGLKSLHFSFGLLILLLFLPRLIAHLKGGTPAIVPAPGAIQHKIAALMHVALYGFMLVMPVLGWLALNAKGVPAALFGFELPILIGADEELEEQLGELHETIGTVGYGLIGLHVLSALVHHFKLKDNTLLRMLPRK